MSGKSWTSQEISYLRDNYSRKPIQTLVRKLKRSIPSIQNKAHYLGFTKQFLNNNFGGTELKKKELIDLNKLGDSLIERLERAKLNIKMPKAEKVFKGKKLEDAGLLLSDCHFFKRNFFVDFETGKSIETYNTQIAYQEANRLLETIQEINFLLSGGYDIRKLHIFALGDILDNEIIIQGQQMFVDVGVGQQLIQGAELLASMLRELLKVFQNIEIVFIGGNHGRMTPRRQPAPFYNNFDYLMGKVLQTIFKDEKRIKVVTPESWFWIHKVFGWRYFLEHGDQTHSWMGHPYYGIARRSTSLKVEFNYDIGFIGHFHRLYDTPIGSHFKTYVNGSWIPKDEYALKKYGFLSTPTQLYFGISPRRPVSWKFELDLSPKIPNGEVSTR